MKLFSFRNLRVLVALVILASVAIYTKQQRLTTQGWYDPILISLTPINVERSEPVQRYIEQLDVQDFQAIEKFLAKQGARFQLIAAPPAHIELNPSIAEQPPLPPLPGSAVYKIIWWSLQFRWWAYWVDQTGSAEINRVKLYLLYYDPQVHHTLAHSLGIQKGLLGIVHLFANKEQAAQNNVIITHEFFHTVGATDKYDEAGLPRFPDGYAQPKRRPLYPQTRAEIMGGRIPQSTDYATIPRSLRSCMVGKQTALEIHWIEATSE